MQVVLGLTNLRFRIEVTNSKMRISYKIEAALRYLRLKSVSFILRTFDKPVNVGKVHQDNQCGTKHKIVKLIR